MAEAEAQSDDMMTLIDSLAPVAAEEAPPAEAENLAEKSDEPSNVDVSGDVAGSTEPGVDRGVDGTPGGDDNKLPAPGDDHSEPEAVLAAGASTVDGKTVAKTAPSGTLKELAEKDKAIDDEIADLEAKHANGEIDDFALAGKVGLLSLKKSRIEKAIESARQEEKQQADALASQWNDWGNENKDIGAERGRKMLAEEFSKLAKKYPNADPGALHVAALEGFNSRIVAVRAANKVSATNKTGTARPVVTPGGGRSLPPVSQQRPPAPKPKTLQDQVSDFANRSGSPEALLA